MPKTLETAVDANNNNNNKPSKQVTQTRPLVRKPTNPSNRPLPERSMLLKCLQKAKQSQLGWEVRDELVVVCITKYGTSVGRYLTGARNLKNEKYNSTPEQLRDRWLKLAETSGLEHIGEFAGEEDLAGTYFYYYPKTEEGKIYGLQLGG